VKHFIACGQATVRLEGRFIQPVQIALCSGLSVPRTKFFFVSCALYSLFPVPFAEGSDSSSWLLSFSVRCQLYAALYFFLIVSRETFFYKNRFLTL
jgi:hypothetical protein